MENLSILSPNHPSFYETGGTIIKIGENFHIDVGATALLHMHPPKHLPIGIVFGVLAELNDDNEENES